MNEDIKAMYIEARRLEEEARRIKEEIRKMGNPAYPDCILFSKSRLAEDEIFYSKRFNDRTYCNTEMVTLCRMIRVAMFDKFNGRRTHIKAVGEMTEDEMIVYCECLDALLDALEEARERMEDIV